MRWEDERYVRFYTRNTPEWLALSWRARGLFGLLMRAVDRAGILAVGKLGPKGVATAIGAPWVEVEEPLAELLADGCVQHNGPAVVIPNFLPAQEAPQSDAARKRTQRERARAEVTKRDQMASQIVTEPPINVTSGHVGSRAVTPSLAVPSLAIETKALSTSQAKLDDVREVFAYWQQVMARPRTKLDDVRRRKIQARLSEGRTVADIKLAIDGCSMRGHNMGDNESGTAYNDIELICRNGPKLEGYLLTAEEAKRPAAGPAYHRETDEEIELRILGGPKHAV